MTCHPTKGQGSAKFNYSLQKTKWFKVYKYQCLSVSMSAVTFWILTLIITLLAVEVAATVARAALIQNFKANDNQTDNLLWY